MSYPFLTIARRVREIITDQVHNVLVERSVRRVLDTQSPAAGSIECVLYFADEPINSYQVRQWYEPMRRLSETHPTAVMVRKPLTAKNLAADCPLLVILTTNMSAQEAFLGSHPVRIVFYVNNNKENFLTLRYPEPVHIHLSHGESDKTSMASNQLKAYDYAFIAGEASRARILRTLKRFDEKHLVQIGRPQLDTPKRQGGLPDDGRTVVLYAPTWEGERDAMAYGSVASHGEAMVAALLSDPGVRLIFRPHPRTGVRDREQSMALKRITSAIRGANQARPGAGHIIDDAIDVGWCMEAADVGIVDISAMAADWLPTRKPMVITQPLDPRANVDPQGLAGALDLLAASEAASISSIVARLTIEGPSEEQLAQVQHHFGDTRPGTSMSRFLKAVEELLP